MEQNSLFLTDDQLQGIVFSNEVMLGKQFFMFDFAIKPELSLIERIKIAVSCIFGFKRKVVYFNGALLTREQARQVTLWLAGRCGFSILETKNTIPFNATWVDNVDLSRFQA